MNTVTNRNYKSWLSILCPLITLIPVLSFVWSTPSEALLTLGAWFVSNVMMLTMLWLLGRLERSSMRRLAL